MTTQTPSDGPQTTSTNEEATLTPKKRGRPPKAKTDALKKGNRVARGRPKGDAARINEYKARMLASPKSAKVLESIFNAALDDDHKSQSAAWKIIVDRIMPVGAFEKEVIKDNGRSAIQINITGVGSTEILGGTEDGSTLEGEYTKE